MKTQIIVTSKYLFLMMYVQYSVFRKMIGIWKANPENMVKAKKSYFNF
jgi:hypothetical protein